MKPEINKLIEKQFGVNLNLTFIGNRKIRVVTKEALDFTSVIRPNVLGLYFGRLDEDGIRLSIEGSQLVGPHATKNVLEIDEKTAREWMAGKSISLKYPKGYVIIKYREDFLGCGKSDGVKILNMVPKERRVNYL
ncbi:MAG: methyltransferase RsmF C-terminal domain-like protein [Candidatus Odinarchaeia archaeon]